MNGFGESLGRICAPFSLKRHAFNLRLERHDALGALCSCTVFMRRASATVVVDLSTFA